MNVFPIYRGLRAILKPLAPTMPYIGQYLPGKQNTGYKVPAIYIEMPKNMVVNFYPGKIKAAKDTIKIHIINNAPFKNHDNQLQEEAQDDHQVLVNTIDKLLTGLVLKDEGGKLLTEQLISSAASMNNYTGMQVYSVLSYSTELFDRNLQQ